VPERTPLPPALRAALIETLARLVLHDIERDDDAERASDDDGQGMSDRRRLA
jgi:hypothetical protein